MKIMSFLCHGPGREEYQAVWDPGVYVLAMGVALVWDPEFEAQTTKYAEYNDKCLTGLASA